MATIRDLTVGDMSEVAAIETDMLLERLLPRVLILGRVVK